ncbi:MAG TPA: hypothetical protein VMV31_09030 [Terriglobales bacterium]|nr:hypothetical protein [Terriglobales bacterium]
MGDLFVLGGVQRPTFKDAQEEWLLFEKAVIGRIRPGDDGGEIRLAYETPLEARASAQSSVLFKAGAVEGDRLYACTSTEVMVFEVPSLRRLAYLSLPFFNDLHHVSPTPRGTILVVVTGLDMVAEITLEGELVQSWSALGGDPWQLYSRDTDYRKVATLKPYRAHPNFAFWAQGELWVSRGDLGDAICLADPRRAIVLGTRECIHDGWVKEGYIYFTSVDGHLYVVSEDTLKVEEELDLNTLGGDSPPGFSWCRGVLPVEGGRAWVCFTRIRQTRWKEKVRWIKNMVSAVSRPTRLALYDLGRRERLQEINLEAMGMHAVFNAVPAPAERPAEEQKSTANRETAARHD